MSVSAGHLRSAGMGADGAAITADSFRRLEVAVSGSGRGSAHRFHVPGRIEVLGKHTDYAGGRSLLTAVDRGFAVESGPRTDGVIRILDVGRGEGVELAFGAPVPEGTPHWSIYPAAVVRRLARDFKRPLCGADISLRSTLPPSSGLSSSTALLIATFEALRHANDLDARADSHEHIHGVLDLAAYLGSVESGRPFRGFSSEEGVGVAGGSQDHTAILASQAGRVCQFGYAPPSLEGSAALPGDLTFVIAVSGVIAQKSGGARAAYNRAAALSGAVLAIWNAATSRADATLFEAASSSADAPDGIRAALKSHRAGEFTPAQLRARFDQFTEETFTLIPQALAALSADDRTGFGELVSRSQSGAERGLENQVAETIELPRMARSLGACASSAFGAGFGGSVWALISRDDAPSFVAAWRRAYLERFERPNAAFFQTDAGPPLLRIE